MAYLPCHAPTGPRHEENQPPAVKIETASSADEMSGTFILHHEDHTLGNSLRYVLARNRETEFVGYSIPHPSDKCVNLRVQSKGRVPARELLRDGLQTLVSVCDELRVVYDEAVASHPSAPAAAAAAAPMDT